MDRRSLTSIVLLVLVIAALVYYLVTSRTGTPQSPSPPTPSPTATLSPTAPPLESADEETFIIALTDTGFSPETLQIETGEKVIWINNSNADATVNSDPHPEHTGYPPLNLGRFNQGQTLSFIFNEPGTFRYHNHINPAQTGSVIVQ